jgi:hypothetical protein
MPFQKTLERRADAAAEFDAQQPGQQGAQVTNSLSAGFTLLRTALFQRIHEDVERFYGTDSMLAPLSIKDLIRMEKVSEVEIEIYQIAVSTEEVSDRGYVRDVSWYRDWLCRLRLGDLAKRSQVKKRLEHYLAEARLERRQEFSGILARAVPEAAKAPLVLYRLYPGSVRIATSLVFDDKLAAAETRNYQVSILPHIADCRECHGRPLDNGEQCESCGNPVWTFEWLRNLE